MIPSPVVKDVDGKPTVTRTLFTEMSDAQAAALQKCENRRDAILSVVEQCTAQQRQAVLDMTPKKKKK